MINIKRLLFAATLLFAGPATAADLGGMLMGVSWSPSASYIGPIDAAAAGTPTAAYGLRAMATAYANGTTKTVNYRRASDNATQDGVALTNGNFDIATANTFAGTHATATCTIATTTITCSAGSAVPGFGDTLTGTGISQPCYLSAVGSWTGGAGTYTGTATLGANQIGASPCGTVSSGETVTFQWALLVTTAYDQTAGNQCTSATCNVVQATAGNQFQLFPNCGSGWNNLPCVAQIAITPAAANLISVNNFTPATGTASLSSVANRVTFTAHAQGVLRENGTNNRLNLTATSGTWQLIGGSSGTVSATVTEGNTYAWNSLLNGISSVVNLNGAETTGTATGNTTAGPLGWLSNNNTGGNIVFVGESLPYDNVTFTQTQRTNTCHNQALFYGITPGTYC